MDNYKLFSKFLQVCKDNNIAYIQDHTVKRRRQTVATVYEIKGNVTKAVKQQFKGIRKGISITQIEAQYAPELKRWGVLVLSKAELKRKGI